eukprot:806977-Amphidinium_carterae.1
MTHSLRHEASSPEGACLCVLGITQNIILDILESTNQTQCQCETTLCSLTVTGGSVQARIIQIMMHLGRSAASTCSIGHGWTGQKISEQSISVH